MRPAGCLSAVCEAQPPLLRVEGQAENRLQGGGTSRIEVAGWQDSQSRGCRVAGQVEKRLLA